MNEACARYREWMSGFIDGELPVDETGSLEAHLAGCPDCRLALAELHAADDALRAAIEREGDPAREQAALERTLARVREEPAPVWAVRRRRSPWNWTVTLRWSAGLAAATAAVLLVMRLGPTPTAPIRSRSIAPSHEVAVPAPIAAAPTRGELAAPSPPAEKKAERVAAVESRKRKEKAGGPEDPATAQAIKAEEPAVTAPAEPARAEPAPPAAEQKSVADAMTNHPADESVATRSDEAPSAPPGAGGNIDAGRPPAETPPAVARPEPYASRESRGGSGERDSRSAKRVAASPERAPSASASPKDGSIWDRAKSNLSGGTARTLDQSSRGYFSETGPPQPWYMTVAENDTTLADRAWKTRLEEAEVEMMSLESAKLRGDERARRYHAIGDLWEWFGRTANDPIADVHALTCYRLAVQNDAQAAALDSTRVQRVRAAVAGLRNIRPAYR